MTYTATLSHVYNRGQPPPAFLDELVEWAREAPDMIFAPNAAPVDIFTVIRPFLATPAGRDGAGTTIYHWDNLLHRKAALLEAMRVHAGLESSWRWNEGVDRTNRTSISRKEGEETGVFQVSFDSTYLGAVALKPFAREHGIDGPETFITAMKRDHKLALEYYGRLVRVNIRWAGPLLRDGENSIYPWLRRTAVAEFQQLLNGGRES